ncbi:MAG: hypothetical protein ABIR27_00890 [Dokdonella sp.]
MSRLVEQIQQALAAFAGISRQPALIGGLALAAHKVVRATRDVDFLVDGADAELFDQILVGLAYQCIHRSEDAANYVRGDEGIDLLYATRPIARRLLTEAIERSTAMGRLRVVSAEGLIGFKLQAWVNDPTRPHDLDDIRALLRAQRDNLDHAEIKEYFDLFDRTDVLEELIAGVDDDRP